MCPKFALEQTTDHFIWPCMCSPFVYIDHYTKHKIKGYNKSYLGNVSNHISLWNMSVTYSGGAVVENYLFCLEHHGERLYVTPGNPCTWWVRRTDAFHCWAMGNVWQERHIWEFIYIHMVGNEEKTEAGRGERMIGEELSRERNYTKKVCEEGTV